MEYLSWFASFAGDHPFLAFCIIWIVGCAVSYSLKLVNRLFRTIKVVARGWPPEHLDADGDWRPQPETEEAA